MRLRMLVNGRALAACRAGYYIHTHTRARALAVMEEIAELSGTLSISRLARGRRSRRRAPPAIRSRRAGNPPRSRGV